MINDLLPITFWWAAIFLLGLISVPITGLFFKKFADKGYGVAKTISILCLSYISFFLATLHILPFTKFSIYLVVTLWIAINLFVLLKNKTPFIKNLGWILFQDILFALGYFSWVFIRGHQPRIEGLEKFMDFGFINSILRSNYLPPTDMWFAGKPINYYWFGHFVTAFLTKLTGVSSAVSYNLMIATIFGLTFSSAVSLITSLLKFVYKRINLKIIIAGIISATVLTLGGNFHTPFYVYKDGAENYWYPDATRFIGYNPETQDKTIHEFPLYSFVVSDLHAHLLNLPFVILFISLLWNFFQIKENEKEFIKSLPLGLVLGVMIMTNTWDFINFSLLTAVTFLAFYLVKTKKVVNLPFLKNYFVVGGLIFTTAIVTAIPFLIHFEQIAQGIKLTHSHSPIWQLLILWGYPLLLFLVLTASLIILKKRGKVLTSDVFLLAMLITAGLLIVIPEIIYIKDIYISSHYRANTMFKLTYAAFVISYLSSGYVILRSINLLKNTAGKIIVSVFHLLIVSSLLIYPYFAVKSYYNRLTYYQGISGDAWLTTADPDSKKTIDFLEDQPGKFNILEAPGDSYTTFNLISSYSGIPTVSGWYVHEWLWRGDSIYPQKRVDDISQIYTLDNITITRKLLEKYDVKFVIIGPNEKERFPNLLESKFAQIGQKVFTWGNLNIFKIN